MRSENTSAMPDTQPPNRRELGLDFTLAQIGLEIIAPLVVGVLIDINVGTMPWLTIAGVVLGFVGGITHIVILSNKQEAGRRDKNRPGKPGSGEV
jgi:F0F1-type ATP synthase assembly protein I